MKFVVIMKDPDALEDAIKEALDKELENIADEDERELIKNHRYEKTKELCYLWFEYGEYLRVEIDTDKRTVEVKGVND